MNALSHEFDLYAAQELPVPASSLQQKWTTIHEAAEAVAQLAQLGSEKPESDFAALPAYAQAQPQIRREAIERGVDDLSAVLQTGLRALIFAGENGCDTTAAAVTLWREFHAAREAVFSLVAPDAVGA